MSQGFSFKPIIQEDLNKQIRFVEADVAFILKLILAFLLIVVGTIDIFIPLAPDWPLILVGIILLDASGNVRRKILSWFPKGYQPKLARIMFWHKKRKG